MAAAGSAIGLGAIWKFPYVAGTNGEEPFSYLRVIYHPLRLSAFGGEFIFGRRNQTNAIDAYKKKRRDQLGFLRGGSA